LLFGRTLLLPQPRGVGVPIVDLARRTRPHLAVHFVDLGKFAALNLGQVVGDEASDRITKRATLDAGR
jgi:hypothetical protein